MPDAFADTGHPDPLGATPGEGGVNFALASTSADSVDVCLFDDAGREQRLRLPGRTGEVFHGFVLGARVGQRYGYRVHGPYAPSEGLRFNPNKLLLDPYARAIDGRVTWHDALYGFRSGAPESDLGFDARDSAPFLPRCVVVDAWPRIPPEERPNRPWAETVIYEAHVKGLTQLHPGVPDEIRGSYAALGHPAVIEHLVRLGMTALELLPIQRFCDDRFLVRKGLVNYWGYSTLNYFTPDPRYGSPDTLRNAIAALHGAGIEVILDVVYNHTAEAEETGPTLSFRGIDNAGYYRLLPHDRRRYVNATGCGNTIDASQPRVVALVVDSLRHWVEQFGVDGFRFDLAPVLGRDPDEFDPRAKLFAAIAADPVLRSVKLIAEPWDVGANGYRLGGFPAPWREWSDRFRDAIRRTWCGDGQAKGALASVLTGSREVFGARDALTSVNYACSHDGYTLEDLVSFVEKHNWANLEGNRDGHNENHSCNHGVEGLTDDPIVNGRRRRHKRNLLACVFLAQGVPMLLMGDELCRSQSGNNNPYCHDNAVNWLDWETGLATDPDLPAFVARLAAIRRRLGLFSRDTFLTGDADPGSGRRDCDWLHPDGREMTGEDWHDGVGVLGFRTGGLPGPTVLLLINASSADRTFVLPAGDGPLGIVLDTTVPDGKPSTGETVPASGGTFHLASRSTVLLTSDTGLV